VKKMMETLKTVIKDIKNDIDTYLIIQSTQKYMRISRKAREKEL